VTRKQPAAPTLRRCEIRNAFGAAFVRVTPTKRRRLSGTDAETRGDRGVEAQARTSTAIGTSRALRFSIAAHASLSRNIHANGRRPVNYWLSAITWHPLQPERDRKETWYASFRERLRFVTISSSGGEMLIVCHSSVSELDFLPPLADSATAMRCE
jgi:hypothetical protein